MTVNTNIVTLKLSQTLKLKETEETIVTTIVEFLQQYLESNLNEKI